MRAADGLAGETGAEQRARRLGQRRGLGIDLRLGDCREVLREMADESVQTVVTSPPFWALRSYLPADHADKRAEIGLEASVGEYLGELVAVFREVKRVLRRDGTAWIEIGDSYAANWSSQRDMGGGGFRETPRNRIKYPPVGLRPKSLCLIPQRLAIALADDGWIVRSVIVWARPNSMPESVHDRCTTAHSYVLMLAKQSNYFYDAAAIAEPVTAEMRIASWAERKAAGAGSGSPVVGHNSSHGQGVSHDLGNGYLRNKRSVWLVPSEPLSEPHYAAFPQKLIEPCILAGTSAAGCCGECGAPWRRVVERQGYNGAGRADGSVYTGKAYATPQSAPRGPARNFGKPTSRTTGWEPSCSHDAERVPCTVLDPFLGSGTTALVALRLGRKCIGVELSEAYIDIALRRLGAQTPPLPLDFGEAAGD